MEAILWSLKTFDPFTLAWPIFLNLVLCFAITQSDFAGLLLAYFWSQTRGAKSSFRPLQKGTRPSALVIIPSLLRDAGDLNAITTTIDSAGNNGYPDEITIVASVDGRTEKPALHRELLDWVAAHTYPENVHVHVTGTETRLGKMMAVEAGVAFMKARVADGTYAKFPALYMSIDGDGTLSEHALERLAHRICTPHAITGNPRRIVAGKICIRPDLFWRGWRAYFTVSGQLYMQVAREFVVSNVSRFNWKPTPMIGMPGALYCTWSEVLLTAPHYMAFMQSLRLRDWLKWWAGVEPPRFSRSNSPSLPEALTGASDDTCMAFLASIASWKDGALSFDAAPTPLHALGRFLRGYFIERSHDYEPEARVYTYSPPTLKGLWIQRVRWNSSRVECAGRFWRGFWYHWEIGFPVGLQIGMILHTVFEVTLYYVVLPYYCFHGTRALLGFLVGYAGQTFAYTLYTGMALVLERDRARFRRVAYCLPLAAAYCIAINFLGCVVGVVKDIFLFGNATNFAPEWTLMKGRCERIALSFRARRFLALSLRALVYGDVPVGTFWLGWQETAWTPSGYEGWTTKKKPRAIFVNARRPTDVAAPPAAAPASRLDRLAVVAATTEPMESVTRLVTGASVPPVADVGEEPVVGTRHSLPSFPPPAGHKRAA